MNSSRTLVKPQPRIQIDLLDLSDEESADNTTPMDHRERVLDAIKSFILRNRGNIPQRKKFTGRRGFGPHRTSARRI